MRNGAQARNASRTHSGSPGPTTSCRPKNVGSPKTPRAAARRCAPSDRLSPMLPARRRNRPSHRTRISGAWPMTAGSSMSSPSRQIGFELAAPLRRRWRRMIASVLMTKCGFVRLARHSAPPVREIPSSICPWAISTGEWLLIALNTPPSRIGRQRISAPASRAILRSSKKARCEAGCRSRNSTVWPCRVLSGALLWKEQEGARCPDPSPRRADDRVQPPAAGRRRARALARGAWRQHVRCAIARRGGALRPDT